MLEAICDYIAIDNPAAAKKVATEIVAHVRSLRWLPGMGRIVPEYRDPASVKRSTRPSFESSIA